MENQEKMSGNPVRQTIIIREESRKSNGLGTADDKLEGFDVGADDYMVKPFDFRELLARVRVLLKRRGSVVRHVLPRRASRMRVSRASR